MQPSGSKIELLKSVEQLIPIPDVYGTRELINTALERDRVDQLLKSSKNETFLVKYERCKCIISNLSCLVSSGDNGDSLLQTSALPNVNVCLYPKPFSRERLVSEEEEVLFCDFLLKLGYCEVTVPPPSKYDRIENRLFSLPNVGRAEP